MNFRNITFTKKDYSRAENGKFWFVNISLLRNPIFEKVIDELHSLKLTDMEIMKLVAITIMYTKSDLELIMDRISPMIKKLLLKRIAFLRELSDNFKFARDCFKPNLIKDLSRVLEVVLDLEHNKYHSLFFDHDKSVVESMKSPLGHLDALIEDMKENMWLKKWLYANSYKFSHISVLYHSFLIPIVPLSYLKKFSRKDDEAIMEKIEYCCFCKFEMSPKVPKFYQNQYYIVECIFDPFRGRYQGMLDMISYIGKLVTPERYEFKHLVTVAKFCETSGEESVRSVNKDFSFKVMKSAKSLNSEKNSTSNTFDSSTPNMSLHG